MKDQWISVADKMPESGHPVLVCADGLVLRAAYIAKFSESMSVSDYHGPGDYCEADDEYYWPEGWYEWNRCDEVHWVIDSEHPVTHWMELPEPPKGKRNGKKQQH